MRALGLIALAAAGIGFLVYADTGRRLNRGIAGAQQDSAGGLGAPEAAGAAGMTGQTDEDVEEIVEDAIAAPHPATAMAAAFEEAVA